jgi:hypothetical protein
VARALAFTLEPSDAFLGVLRLKAVVEAGRWPSELSLPLRAAIDREFDRCEPTIRALGLAYADLEESGIGQVNREPQSRFEDVDGALHLCACAVSIALDLDHLRVAFDRGDLEARRSAAGLTFSLRTVLWYLARSDLCLCTGMTFQGRDSLPERALDIVDTFLGAAWALVPKEDPPLPATQVSVGTRTLPLTPALDLDRRGLGDDTVVWGAPVGAEGAREVDGQAPTAPSLSPFAALSEDGRFFLFQADISERDWPVSRATILAARRNVLLKLQPDRDGAHDTGMYAAAERGADEVLELLARRGKR